MSAVTGDKLALLQRMPIFGGVGEDALAFLIERSRRVETRAGDYFFRDGERGSSAHVLERGRAVVLKVFEGREHPLQDLEPGACFGEVALFDFGLRSASVRASEDCVSLELSARDLHALAGRSMEQFAIVYMNLGREVSRRLRLADERLFRVRVRSADPAVDGYDFRPS